MTAQLADEPELVQAVAKIAAQLDATLARQVIDLCSACFDAGVASARMANVESIIERARTGGAMSFKPPASWFR